MVIWNSIDIQAHKLMEYSKKWNKAGKLICSFGMDELILILRPQVHSMVVSQLYALSANIGYVEFNTKFGGVIKK
ncbi:hypothetical protein [endosymbiont GvMRE of Glomus versiforme]|uniref:hypothetical protein n=1 Tax=endosymbiont GvMRE of Glomus versiforme TaxID=2039283 RepID=UPI0011C4A9A7|nr:hypothetical protein [endosymbiont GvMRE of Glomus versiforme]